MTTTSAPAKPIRRIAKSAGRTTLAKVGHVDARWYIVDAAGKTLGRLASAVAVRLMGKHKPIYTNSRLDNMRQNFLTCLRIGYRQVFFRKFLVLG